MMFVIQPFHDNLQLSNLSFFTYFLDHISQRFAVQQYNFWKVYWTMLIAKKEVNFSCLVIRSLHYYPIVHLYHISFWFCANFQVFSAILFFGLVGKSNLIPAHLFSFFYSTAVQFFCRLGIKYKVLDIFLRVLTETGARVWDTNRRKGHPDQQRHKEGQGWGHYKRSQYQTLS